MTTSRSALEKTPSPPETSPAKLLRGVARSAPAPPNAPTRASEATSPAKPPPDSRRASWISVPINRRTSSPATPAPSRASTARSASAVFSYALQSAFMRPQCRLARRRYSAATT